MSESFRSATCPKCGHPARLAPCVLCGGLSPLVPRSQCPRCKSWGYVVRCAPCDALAAEEARAEAVSALQAPTSHHRLSGTNRRFFHG
jgi:hypothetical protein